MIGAFRVRGASDFPRLLLYPISILLLLSLVTFTQFTQGVAPASLQSTKNAPFTAAAGVWNPSVTNCMPSAVPVVTVSQVLGTVANPTQTPPNQGADYSGGWVLNGTHSPGFNPQGWPFSKRQLPSTIVCSYPVNSTTTPVLSSYVEIDNVRLSPSVAADNNIDCIIPGSVYCDSTFNVADFSCPGTNQYMCRIHGEIDQTWKQNGIAPPIPPNGTQIMDIQGYVYWDPQWLNQQWHSYSGWEIHPLAAWRFHNDPNPQFYLAPAKTSLKLPLGGSNSSTINVGALNGFTGTVTLSTMTLGPGSVPPQTNLSDSSISPFNFGGNMPKSVLTVSAPPGTSEGLYDVTVKGQGGGMTLSTTIQVAVGTPHIDLSASPAQITVNVGSFALSTIAVTGANGFSGNVTLAASIPPPNSLGYSVNPRSVVLGQGETKSSTLNVTASSGVAPGDHVVTITATSGSFTNSTAVTVHIVDFTFSQPGPPPQTVAAGSRQNVTITVNGLNSFTGTVVFSASVSPSGPSIVSPPTTGFDPTSVSLSQTSTSATTTLTISTTILTTTTTYTIKVSGTSGSMVRSTPLTVTVTNGPDFAISVNPNYLNILANDTSSSAISVGGYQGFSGTVNLSARVSPVVPNGPGASLSSASVTVSPSQNGTSTVFVSTNGLTTAANYTITITGNWTGLGGFRSHSISVRVEVSKFSLTANPATMTVLASSQGTSNIGLSMVGHFSGTVNLNATVASSGVNSPTASLTSLTVQPGGFAGLTVTTTSSVLSGNYTVIVRGTSGKFSTIVKVIVTVSKFKVTTVPGALLFSNASNQTSTVTMTGYGGFSGTVSLSAMVSPVVPNGPSASLSLTNVLVNSGPDGVGTSVLRISTTGSTPYQNYTITVTGVYSSLSMNANVTVTVVKFAITGPTTPLNIPPGSTGTTSITISLGGFSGNVCLTITPSSSSIGITPSPSPPCVTVSDGGSSSVGLTIFTSSSAPANTFSVKVVGTSGSKTSNYFTFLIKVGKFSVAAPSTIVSVLANSTYTQNTNVTSLNGFSGNVNLSGTLAPTSAPFPPTVSLNPQSVTLTPNGTSTSTLQIITIATTTDGTYFFTILGSSGSLTSNQVTITIHVTKFTISATPSSLTFAAGSPATSTLNVTSLPPNSNGFAGTVTLVVTVSSPGLTANSDSTTVTLSSGSWQTAVLHIASSTPGKYTVTVKGVSSPYSKTITIPVTVSQTVTISTRLSASTIQVGSSVSDSATLAGETANAGGTVTYAYWNSGTCIGTRTVVSAVTVTNGVVPSSASVTFNTPGSFSWNATYSGDASNRGAQSQCEPLLVNPPVSISTLINDVSGVAVTSVTVGSSVHDTATISGGSGTFTGIVTYHLFNNGACTGTPTTTQAVTIGTGNIVPNSPATSPAPVGSYSYDATYGGDSNNSPATSTCEPLAVNKATPSISSTVSPSTIIVGQSAADLASVVGGFSPTGTVTYTAYSDPACTSLAFTAPNAPLGSQSAAFTPTGAGAFQWISTYSGDVNNNMVATPCGNEPLIVNKATPSLTTTITPSSTVSANTPVADHASITGGFPSNGVTGAVAYTFFANGVCSGAGTTEGTVTIGPGNSVPPSNQVTPTTPGSYSFNATYSGDGNNNAAKSVCELLTVQNLPVPTLTTTIKSTAGVAVASVVVGDSIHDTATISGGSGTITGSITYNFFGNGGCTGSPASAQTVTIGTGNVVPDSAPTIPSPAGPYGYQASYSGDPNNGPVASGCEPMTVNKASPTVTTVLNPSSTVTVGTATTDQATINGGFPSAGVSGTVTYNFFTNSACTGVPTSQTVNVGPANGVPVSASQTLGAGSYSYNAAYSGDANNNAASSLCEPLTVNKASITSLTTTVTSPITIGSSATISATLIGGYPSTGVSGSVTHTTFTGAGCTGTGAVVGTVTIGASNGVPSASDTPPSAGSFSYQASYSGDTNNNAFTGACANLTVNKATLSVTTSITPSSTVTPGTAVTDHATLTGGFPSTGVTGTVSYFSFTGGTCSGTSTPAGTFTVGAGNSVPASNSVTPSSTGQFSFNATYSGDGNNNGVSSSCELLTVTAALTITTVISPSSSVGIGSSVTDQATVSGGIPSTGVTGTVTYAFFNNGLCNGTPTSTSTATVGAGNSVPASASVTPSPAGSFAFNATYSGDANNPRTSSACEQLTVNKASITSLTTGVTSPITVGSSTAVSATLTGGFPSTGVSGTVAYTKFTGAGCTGTGTVISTLTIGAANAVPSASETPAPAGSYSYQASYSGDTNNNAFTGTCANLIVNKTNITSLTTAVTSPITVGNSATVSTTLVGGFPSAGVSGTVTYTRFSTTSCTGTGTVVTTVTIGASNAVPSASDTPSAAGSYSYQASYGGDTNNNASTGTCANLTVSKTNITSLTTVVTSPIAVGSSTTVSVTLTGGFPSTGVSGSVTYTRFTGTGCIGTGAVISSVNIGPGNSAPSASDTPSSAGSYGYQASYSGDANNNAATGNCGALTVNKASPTIGTVIKDSTGATVTSITVGTSVHDTATTSSEFQAGGTVTYTIFSNGACNAPGTVIGSPVTVTNGVVPDSAATTPSPAGSYGFQASYGGDANNNPASGSCEPLTVNPLGVNINTVVKNSAGAAVTSVTVGTAVHDTSSLSGASATAGGTVTYNAYSGTTCSGTPILAQTVSVTNSVVPDSKSMIINFTGTIEWQALYSGDPSNQQATSACGSEQLSINPATTTTSTKLSASSILIGQTVSDSATLSGFFVGFSPGGTLSYEAFSGTTCSGAPVFLQTVNVDANTGAVPHSRAVQFNSSGTYEWQAIYNGDTNNGASSSSCGSESLSVGTDPTTTTISCSPASFPVNTATSCTATVRDIGIAPVTPGGSVSLTLDSSAAPFATCNLSPVNSTSANCPANFTSSQGSAGSHTITATYSGDLVHPTSSSGSTSISVTARTTSTSVSCIPGTVALGQFSTCTGTVTDTSGASSAITPTGSVTFSSTGAAGGFSGSPCALAPVSAGTATCRVTFTPSSSGIASVTGAYSPGADTNHGGSDSTVSPAIIHITQTVSISTVIKDSTGTPVATVTVGNALHDTATITGAAGGAGGSVTYNFFSNNACSGAFTSQVVTVINGAVPDSSSTTPALAGQYSYNATYSGDANNSEARSPCEPLTVSKASPGITTTIKDSTGAPVTSVTVGATVHDSATLSNGFAPITGNVGYTFFGNGACSAPGTPAGTVTITNGAVPDSPAETPTTPGSYSFQAIYLGDPNNNGATSLCEPLNVTAKLTPNLTTTIKDSSGVAINTASFGAAVHDTATFSGGFPTITGSVTYTVFSNSACTAPGTQVSAFSVGPGNSVPDSNPITPSSPGPYGFQASYAGDANNNPATSPCEPLTVNKAQPSLTTAVSPSASVSVGSFITDTSSLSAGFNPGAVGSTVTYTLFSFTSLPSTAIPCSGGTTVGAPQIVTITTAGVVPNSAPVTPTPAGFYGFSATFNGDANNNAATSNCEPLTVNKANPTISTVIRDSTGAAVTSITVGGSVHDTAITSNGFQAGGTVTYTIFSDAACTTSRTTVGTPVTVTNGLVPDSASVTPSPAGSYGFQASYAGDANNNVAVSPCEPLTVSGDFAVSASPQSLNTDVGIPISTTITVTSNGFTGSVSLSASSSPSGLLETFSANPVPLSPGGTGTSNMTVTVPSALAPGTYTITVTGTSGSISRKFLVTVNVADFQISAGAVTPSVISAGSTGTSTMTVTPVNGFTDTVTLSVSASSPVGLACTIIPPSIPGSGSSNLSCSALVPADYTVTVTGKVAGRGGSLSHSTSPIVFHIVDFQVSATSPVSFNGSQGSTTLTVTPLNNFQGTVNIAWTTNPTTGLTVSCPTSVSLPPQSVQACQLTASTPGSYSANITGTSGSLSHYSIVVVNGGDFSMTTTSSPIIMTQSGSGKAVITLTSLGGFSGSVNLQASSPDPTISIIPSSTTLTLSAGQSLPVSFTVATTSTTPYGNYTLTFQGFGGSLTHQVTVSLIMQDFSLLPNPGSQSLPVGSQGTTVIAISSLNGFSGSVSLTATATGIGVSPGTATVSVTPGPASTWTLTILTTGSHVGSYTVTVRATSGTVFHSILFNIDVTNFSVSSLSSFVTIQAGSSGTTTIQVVGQNGFAGNVSLTVVPRSALTFGFSPPIVALSSATSQGSSTLTIAVASNAALTTYTITVIGTSGTLSNQGTFSVQVTAPADFTVTADPVAPSPVNVGSSGISTIHLSGQNGFSGTISLSTTSPVGSGLVLTFNPTTSTLSSSQPSTTSQLTVDARSAVAGVYTITIYATNGTAGPIKSATLSVTVADFTITASPNPMPTLGVGVQGSSTITVTGRDGFSGTVSLSLSPSQGLSASVNPQSLSGSGSAVLMVSASSAGNYNVNVTASSGSLVHFVLVQVKVGDFTVTANPQSLAFNVGSSAKSVVTITSNNGFSGSVTLSVASVTPADPTISSSFSTFTVSLPPNGQVTSTITIFTTSSTLSGNYTVIVVGTTGTSGSQSSQVAIALVLGDFSISANPGSWSFPSGSQGTSTVVVSSQNGFIGTVMLTPTFSTVGVTLNPSSVNVSPGSPGTAFLAISTRGAQAAAYTITVRGTAGSATRQVQVMVSVTDFVISSTSNIIPVQAGSSGSTTITLTPSLTGFSGNISLTALSSTQGITPGLNPGIVALSSSVTSGSSQLVVQVDSSVTPGLHTVTVTGAVALTGTSGQLSHNTQITVNVGGKAGFTIQASPSNFPVVRGSSSTTTISVTSFNNFTGTVSFTATVTLLGPASQFNPPTVTLTRGATLLSILTVSAASSVPTGSYTIDVNGTSGSTFSDVKITVTVGDYSISSSKGTNGQVVNILTGSSDTSTITLSSQGGFSGVVNLSAISSPAGLSPSLGTNSIGLTGGGFSQTILTINTGSAPPRPYTVTVIATFGSISHNVTLAVSVVDFGISVSPNFLTIPLSTSQSSTITLTSLGGFAGSVSLVASVPSSGLAANCSPSPVGLLSGGQAFSICKFTPSVNGTYFVTVTGFYGIFSHYTTVTIVTTATPDFTMIGSPSSLTMPTVVSNFTTITLTSRNFNGTVNLAVSSVTNPFAIAFLSQNSVTLTPGLQQSVFLTVSGPPTSFSVTVSGTAGTLVHFATVSVFPYDFSVSTASQLTIVQGSQSSPDITVTSVDGFARQVSLFASAPSAGLTASVSPSAINIPAYGSAKTTLFLASSAYGNYNVTITVTSGQLVHTTSVLVHVTAFSMALSPTSISVTAGSSGTATLTLTSTNGFQGTVLLAQPTISPSTSPNPSASLSSTSILVSPAAPSFVILTVNVPLTAPTQVYTVTVQGTSGLLQLSAAVSLNVNAAPDFTIGASQSNLIIDAGPSGSTSIITVQSINSFSGTVSLTVSASPAGATVFFSPPSVSVSSGVSATSILTFSSSISGNYVVQVTATNGALVHQLVPSISVRVVDFGISTSPRNSIPNVPVGGLPIILDVSLTSSNGFTGSVSILVSSNSSGLSFSPSLQILTLGTGGTGTTVSISSNKVGTYTLNVTATSRSLTRSVALTVYVVDFSLVPNGSTITVPENSLNSFRFSVSPTNGFTGTVSFSSSAAPPGPAVSMIPPTAIVNGGSANSTLVISTTNSPPTGQYLITVTASYGLLSHSATLTVYVVNFAVNVNPSTLTFSAGSSVSSIINVASQGNLQVPVVLTAVVISGPPGGLTVSSLNPATVLPSPGNPSTSTLNVTSTTVGNYVVRITGTSGSLAPYMDIRVVVTDFGLSASPVSQSFPAGASRQVVVTVTSLNGFAENVTLTDAMAPSGPDVSMAPSSVLGSGRTTLTISTNSTTALGTYTIIVTGTDGTLVHTVSFTVAVTPAPVVSVSSSSLTVNPGGVVRFTVTVTDADTSKTITLTVVPSTLPQGASFPTASGSSRFTGTFNWIPSSSQASGDYAVEFTATDGQGGTSSLVRVTIHVNGISRSPSLLSSLGVYWYAIIALVGAVGVVVGDRLWKQRNVRLAKAAKATS